MNGQTNNNEPIRPNFSGWNISGEESNPPAPMPLNDQGAGSSNPHFSSWSPVTAPSPSSPIATNPIPQTTPPVTPPVTFVSSPQAPFVASPTPSAPPSQIINSAVMSAPAAPASTADYAPTPAPAPISVPTPVSSQVFTTDTVTSVTPVTPPSSILEVVSPSVAPAFVPPPAPLLNNVPTNTSETTPATIVSTPPVPSAPAPAPFVITNTPASSVAPIPSTASCIPSSPQANINVVSPVSPFMSSSLPTPAVQTFVDTISQSSAPDLSSSPAVPSSLTANTSSVSFAPVSPVTISPTDIAPAVATTTMPVSPASIVSPEPPSFIPSVPPPAPFPSPTSPPISATPSIPTAFSRPVISTSAFGEPSAVPPPKVAQYEVRTLASDVESLKASGGLETTAQTFIPTGTTGIAGATGALGISGTGTFNPTAVAPGEEVFNPATVAPVKKKNSKKAIFIILGIIILATIGITGFMFIRPLLITPVVTPEIIPPAPIVEEAPITTAPARTSFFITPANFSATWTIVSTELAEIRNALRSPEEEEVQDGAITEIIIKQDSNDIVFHNFLTAMLPNKNPAGITASFEDNFTLFVHRSGTNDLPGFIAKGRPEITPETMSSLSTALEASPNLKNFYAVNPGVMSAFRAGSIAGNPIRYASFAAGFTFNYGWFKDDTGINYLVVASSHRGMTRAIELAGF